MTIGQVKISTSCVSVLSWWVRWHHCWDVTWQRECSWTDTVNSVVILCFMWER